MYFYLLVVSIVGCRRCEPRLYLEDDFFLCGVVDVVCRRVEPRLRLQKSTFFSHNWLFAGGSYLGPEFVFEALKCEPAAQGASTGRTLRFLANVDPVDVSRAITG